MKINMNQMPDEEPASKKSRSKKAKPAKTTASAPKTTIEDAEPETEDAEPRTGDTEPETGDAGSANKEGLKGLVRKNKFWIVVCIVLFIVFLSVNSNMNNAKTRFTIKLRNLTSETSELKSAIEEVKAALEEQAKIDAHKLTDEEEESAYSDAIKQGELVATLQNTYKNANSFDNQEEFQANVNALDACFDTNSKEARVRWYGDEKSIPGTWKFASKAGFRGSNAKVLWLCYSDEDSKLLAYCTASYNAETKLFTNVKRQLTKYAEANIGTDDATGEEKPSDVNSMIGSIKALAEDGTVGTDEELNDETINKNNEMSESRESLKSSIKDGEMDGESYDPRYNIGLDDSSNDTEGADNDENAGE